MPNEESVTDNNTLQFSEKFRIFPDIAEEVIDHIHERSERLLDYAHNNSLKYEKLLVEVGTIIEEARLQKLLGEEGYSELLEKRELQAMNPTPSQQFREIVRIAKNYGVGKKAITHVEGRPYKVRRLIKPTEAVELEGLRGKKQERLLESAEKYGDRPTYSQHKIVFCKEGQWFDPIDKQCYMLE